MMRVRSALVGLVVVGFWSSALVAQEQPPGADQVPRPELEKRLRAAFERRVREDLGLTDQEIERVREVWRDVALDRQELQAEERLLSIRFERLAGDGGEGDGATAQALLDRLLELRQREVDIFSEEQTRLLAFLDPLRVIRLNLLRSEVTQRIRRARQRGG